MTTLATPGHPPAATPLTIIRIREHWWWRPGWRITHLRRQAPGRVRGQATELADRIGVPDA